MADVWRHGAVVSHALDGDVPAVEAGVRGTLDWEWRYALMRTNTALHILCGVIYKRLGGGR